MTPEEHARLETLNQITDSVFKQSISNEEKFRSLKLIVFQALPAYQFKDITDSYLNSILVKVLKCLDLLAIELYLELIENKLYEKIIDVILPFLDLQYVRVEVGIQVKGIIVTIINLFHEKIRSPFHCTMIKEFLYRNVFEFNLSSLFALFTSNQGLITVDHPIHEIVQDNNKKLSILSSCVTLIQIFLEPKYSEVLGLEDKAWELESSIRKVFFCLDSFLNSFKQQTEKLIDMPVNKFIHVLDYYTSILFTSLLKYFIEDLTFPSSKRFLLLSKAREYLHGNHLQQFPKLQASLANCLLKLLYHLVGQDDVFVMKKSLNISPEWLLKAELSLDPLLVHVLNVCSLVFEYKSSDSFSFTKDHVRILSQPTTVSIHQLKLQILTSLMERNTSIDVNRELLLCRDNEIVSVMPPSNDISMLLDSEVLSTDEQMSAWLRLVVSNCNLATLSGLEMIYLIQSLGKAACISAHDFNFPLGRCNKCDTVRRDSSHPIKYVSYSRPSSNSNHNISTILSLLHQLLELDSVRKSDVHTLNLLLSLRRVFTSYQPPPLTNSCVVWKFISSATTHNVREIRLLAVTLLSFYFITPQNTQYNNTFLKISTFLGQITLSDSNSYLTESTVLAWAQLALVSGVNEHLYVTLMKLINYVGSQSQIQSTLAIHSLKTIAYIQEKTPYQLLYPFLPKFSVIVVKQLKSRPMLVDSFTKLVSLSLQAFLKRTQEYTVPYVLQSYKHDIIGIMAHELQTSKPELIETHLPQILGYLLTINDPTLESDRVKITAILGNINGHYRKKPLKDLLKINFDYEFAWAVLQNYSPESQNEKSVRRALIFIARTTLANKSETFNFTEEKILELFFDKTILAIMQLFSFTINNLKGIQPEQSRLQALYSINYLIELSGSALVSCLPQIRTSLQVSISSKHLQLESLECLKKLIVLLKDKDLYLILDFVVSLIVLKYDELDDQSKNVCQSIMGILYSQKFDSLKKELTNYVFSLSSNQQFVSTVLKTRIDHRAPSLQLLSELAKRCNNDNKWVVMLALDSIESFLTVYDKSFHSEVVYRKKFSELAPLLIKTLLNTSFKFRFEDKGIASKCAKVIAKIGLLDIPRSNHISKKDSSRVILRFNFSDTRESIRFVRTFIDIILVKAFSASGNPSRQLYLAYSIQEYLKFMGLEEVDISSLEEKVGKTSEPDVKLQLWNGFSDISKAIIAPLLHSKYTLQFHSYHPKEYPIFSLQKTHSQWLTGIVDDLLNRSQGKSGIYPHAQHIFFICTSAVRGGDLSVCEFILPYIWYSIIASGDEELVELLFLESFAILDTNIDDLRFENARDSLKACYQTLFDVFDYCRECACVNKHGFSPSSSSNSRRKYRQSNSQRLEGFLSRFPQELLAKRSAQCKFNERAILHLEESYRAKKIPKEEFISTIQSMYAEIDDIDALDGVLRKYSTASLDNKLAQVGFSDNWSVTLEAFKTSAENEILHYDNNFKNNTRLLKTLLEQHYYSSALEKLSALISQMDWKPSSIPTEWISIGLLASVFSRSIEDTKRWVVIIEKHPETSVTNSSELLCIYETAKALINLHDNKKDATLKSIERAFGFYSIQLWNVNSLSLIRKRDLFTQLHCLEELHQIASSTNRDNFELTSTVLDSKIEHAGHNFSALWSIISTRRVVEENHPKSFVRDDLRKTWTKSAKIARKFGRLDLAMSSIVNVMSSNDLDSNLEYSKILWAQGEQINALKLVDKIRTSDIPMAKRTSAKIQLKYSKWLDQSANAGASLIINEYNEAINLDNSWNKPHYHLAKFYNKLLESNSNRMISLNSEIEQSSRHIDGFYEVMVVKHYVSSLLGSPKYVFEVLPKMITVWLDFAATYKQRVIPSGFKPETIHKKLEENRATIHKSIRYALASLPRYYWYIALSQMISRVLHGNSSTKNLLITIIAEVVRYYPQRAIWSVFSVVSSMDKERSVVGSEIVEKVKTSKCILTDVSNYGELLDQCWGVIEKFYNICNLYVKAERNSTLKLLTDFKFRTLSINCNHLVLPIKTNFNIVLPNSGSNTNKSNSSFPAENTVKCHLFENNVSILSSLQKPRRVSIWGDDGVKYSILCKANDDLRKDAKMMEFSNVIDRLLSKDTESEKRSLSVLSYAVVPLNEKLGLIEWVNDCSTMKSVLFQYYQSKTDGVNFTYLKNMLAPEKPLEVKLRNFEEVSKKYQPYLRHWFMEEFPDPAQWYHARSTFTRSTAVMSMIGYLTGLGDRHGDNILISHATGSVLHVDFDCLFGKGETLQVPERVPFRLTQNMVDAFGVTGCEGSFRKGSEVTLALMRNHESLLMNTLETFLYDPILDWASGQKNKKNKSMMYNAGPEVAMAVIRRKIRGILDADSMPLSVAGQVEALILEATSSENLCQMFVGWMPFL
ncbi:PI kinase superfamily member [Komagataella phaffii CBS 7435]|uniref:Serine/threonine-protein kinase MEC1 n=2 Tax=Komagataella phaffii TaxID=460519 RepID=C4R286_KOMPG|nr:Genome integrity checkpoint protein and PI kinase superfamily member [Komagataella phaffii GS115]AOA62489.1 GQ67_01030T0 [Komagataella phaffii]CAH2447841.1 PI kinase superfamily member [Komagataella phaffii CBS 7435]AOA67853.1 GQ68_00359T0 [Komagataella phaffii GS115]CAY69610.1 Genome integrity checkpoint protein and PI kinase superfamily member [Komagataella phaffii GS115]CCA38009.1 PI kinase superfamily member [Komagataella phaffii CBS 7435]